MPSSGWVFIVCHHIFAIWAEMDLTMGVSVLAGCQLVLPGLCLVFLKCRVSPPCCCSSFSFPGGCWVGWRLLLAEKWHYALTDLPHHGSSFLLKKMIHGLMGQKEVSVTRLQRSQTPTVWPLRQKNASQPWSALDLNFVCLVRKERQHDVWLQYLWSASWIRLPVELAKMKNVFLWFSLLLMLWNTSIN